MKYAFVFGLLALMLIGYAAVLQGVAWLLIWPAVSFLLVAAAYGGLGPCMFGKRTSGQIAWWALLLLLPFFFLAWGVWHLQRLISKEDCWNEVVPGLFLGRRSFVSELPPGVGLVVDLTSEFRAARGVGQGREYVCLPTLDACPPDEKQLRRLVRKITDWPGSVYVHCAQGHGRSAVVVAAVLLARGIVADVPEAVERLKAVRPGVRLKKSQRELLERLRKEVEGTTSS